MRGSWKDAYFEISTSSNGDATGTLSGDGFRVDIILIGRTVWLSGDRAFWAYALPRKNAGKLAGKYARTTLSSTTLPDLKAFMTRAEFAAEWPTDAVPDGREVVNGVDAYRLREVRTGGVMSVALSGEPYPLRIAGGGATVDFVVFEKPLELDPPDAEDVVAVLP
jgi:hypothetical protein